jgi:hypothetical protein
MSKLKNSALVFTLMLFGLAVPLLIGEGILRAIDFRYRLYPEKIEFGWPNPQVLESIYTPDDDLLWVPKTYHAEVTELISSPPDVLLLGDSCTQFGTYHAFLQEDLAALYPQRNLKVAKLGVGGWASYQGRLQMIRDVTRIKPKIATIYFGWNDHWIGFGVEDKVLGKIRSPLYRVVEASRLAQLATKVGIELTAHSKSSHPYRVSEEDYAENLKKMVAVAKANGIKPVLLTAPSSHVEGKEPQYLKKRHLKDLSQLVPLHQRYVNITRQVGIETNTPVCDLAAEFAKIPNEELVAKYFNRDGIHLTKEKGEGYDKLAEFLSACLQEKGLLNSL